MAHARVVRRVSCITPRQASTMVVRRGAPNLSHGGRGVDSSTNGTPASSRTWAGSGPGRRAVDRLPCPTISIHTQHALSFPRHTVGDQTLPRARVASMIPQNQDAYFVIHFGNMDRAVEIPLLLVSTTKFFAIFRRDGGCPCFRFDFFPATPDLAIRFQVAHVTTRLAETVALGIPMMEVLHPGIVAVPTEISRNVALPGPAGPLPEEHTVILMNGSSWAILWRSSAWSQNRPTWSISLPL